MGPDAVRRRICARARRQLGMPTAPNSASDETTLDHWWASVRSDPDLGKDVRMMVPVYIDALTGKIRVWAVLGLSVRPLRIYYATDPGILEVLDASGKKVPLERFDVSFYGARHDYPYIVSAELSTSKILDRPSFRRLCDQYKTFRSILAHLR